MIIGPADALVGEVETKEAQIRSRLLRNGLVESVTISPGGADPSRPGYGNTSWTLRREPGADARGRVLISDIGDQP